MRIDIWDLDIDDDNREKMHDHGISVRTAFEVVDGSPAALSNDSPDGAPILLVGPTNRGFVTLPLDPTPELGRWRPRTGYPSKARDIARCRQSKAKER